MRTFAFIPGQLTKAYTWIVSKYKRYDNIVELFKVGAASLFLLVCILFYLYFVNLSSTRGYFLKQADQNMTAINFKYEILKTKLLDYKQQNWDAVQSTTFKRDVVDVSAEIVKIPNGVQLGFLSVGNLVN
ncbi:MAG: hypothetical protein ACD_80C00005G0002 [uncultured bacterium (gcode 4)]|uniref:Uncharacterized protein n=1 Tax=uncultured bacterium (gcode 4) TaxID=1234023 RepID=K1XKN9_9BACT|nr:MAG: hypothetical protein ACD_80C00005G0002 [uncultured bacterium (gcode 4)]